MATTKRARRYNLDDLNAYNADKEIDEALQAIADMEQVLAALPKYDDISVTYDLPVNQELNF